MRSIAILVFDEIEVLDLGGPFEVFSVANRVAVARGEDAPFVITLCAPDPSRPVVARGGLRLIADVDLDEEPAYDVVIVPGGDTSAIEEDERVLSWVRRAARRADIRVSICTGAFVLARAGALDGRPVTTHWMDIAGLRATFPDLDVREDVRYIDHGDLATSAGISAGIDLSLHLVRRLAGADLAREVARRMEYRWDEGSTATGGPATDGGAGEPAATLAAAEGSVVARVWSGVVRAEDGDDYAAYMRRTGVPGYTAIPGNLGVRMLRRRVDAGWEFVMFSLWGSMEAITAFAGSDPEVAVFYPEDDRFLIERDLRVRHYEVHTSADPVVPERRLRDEDDLAERSAGLADDVGLAGELERDHGVHEHP